MTKKEVKEKLKQVYSILLECEIALADLNQNGEQFDFCTDDELATTIDNVSNRAQRIQTKVYQD